MISMDQLKAFYPPFMSGNAAFAKHILKEYIQLLILDFLSGTHYIRKISFIGGSSLRLIKGIDRFSEDLDFDCKNLSEEEFIRMSGDVLVFLKRSGFNVETRNRDSVSLKAFRSNLHFPEFLFELKLSGHREERFLLKLEAEDQGVFYQPALEFIKGCGFFFSFPVPPAGVLCSMKIAALLDRGKGRDFYDVMFLLAQVKPDYSFLETRCDIGSLPELKTALEKKLNSVDITRKQKDFEHLLFNRDNGRRILNFGHFVESL